MSEAISNRKVDSDPDRVDFLTTIVDTSPYNSCDLGQSAVPPAHRPGRENMNKPAGGVDAWDRHAINAEIRRRGMTLTGIAEDAGLYSSACRQGIIGMSRPGAEAIAKALDIPFRVLFPDSYSRGRHNEGQNTRNAGSNTSAKRGKPADSSQRAS